MSDAAAPVPTHPQPPPCAPRPCHDCGAAPGALHDRGCDVERCPLCGGQLISCGCCYAHFYPGYRTLGGAVALPPDVYERGLRDDQAAAWERVLAAAGRLPWTGVWPGDAECREFGWFSRWVEGRGWVRCEGDHPDAGADLNRLATEAVWDPTAKRFRRREPTTPPAPPLPA